MKIFQKKKRIEKAENLNYQLRASANNNLRKFSIVYFFSELLLILYETIETTWLSVHHAPPAINRKIICLF